MPVTKNCERCHKPYSLPPSEASRSTFCSRACRHPATILICKGCKQPFRVSPWERTRAKFCSRACKKLLHVAIQCGNCKATFYVAPNLAKSARYCGSKCQYEARRVHDFADGLKACSKCEKRLPPEQFSKDKSQSTGLRAVCRECQFIANWLQRHKGDTEEDARRALVGWQRLLIFEIVTRTKWCATGEHFIPWGDFTTARRQRHGLAVQCKNCWQSYYRANYDLILTRVRNAHAKRKGAEGDYTLKEWRAKFREFDGKCYLCGKPVVIQEAHKEHRTPLSRGGTNFINNIAPACPSCNLAKGTKTEAEYRAQMSL